MGSFAPKKQPDTIKKGLMRLRAGTCTTGSDNLYLPKQ